VSHFGPENRWLCWQIGKHKLCMCTIESGSVGVCVCVSVSVLCQSSAAFGFQTFQGEYFLTSKRERLELENIGWLTSDFGIYVARSVTSGLHYGTMDMLRECRSSADGQMAFGFQLFTSYNGTRLRQKWDSWPDLTKHELGVQQVRLICQDDSFIQSPQTRFYALRYNYMIVHKCKTPGSYLNGFDCAITQTGIATIRMSCSDGSVLTDTTMKDHAQSKWVLPWQGWQRCAHGYGISGLQAESLSGPMGRHNKKGVLLIRFKCKKQASWHSFLFASLPILNSVKSQHLFVGSLI
jgi:hypothetical protein